MKRTITTTVEKIESDFTGREIDQGGWALVPLNPRSDIPDRHFESYSELVAWIFLKSGLHLMAEFVRVYGLDVKKVR